MRRIHPIILGIGMIAIFLGYSARTFWYQNQPAKVTSYISIREWDTCVALYDNNLVRKVSCDGSLGQPPLKFPILNVDRNGKVDIDGPAGLDVVVTCDKKLSLRSQLVPEGHPCG